MKKVLVMLACGAMFLLTSCGGDIKSDAKKMVDLQNKIENCKGDDCIDLIEEAATFAEKMKKKYSSPEDQEAFGKEVLKLIEADLENIE